MDWLIFGGVVVVLVALGILAQKKGWIDLGNKSTRGPGAGAGAFGALDEVFFPTKHAAQEELDRQSSLPAPAPIPGDGEGDIYSGRVRIELDDERR